MHDVTQSMAVAAHVPENLPEEKHAPPPPEIPAPPSPETPPPPPDAWHAVEHHCRPGEFASRAADGLLYRQRRRM